MKFSYWYVFFCPLMLLAQDTDPPPYAVYLQASRLDPGASQVDQDWFGGIGFSWQPGKKTVYEADISLSEHDRAATTSGTRTYELTTLRAGISQPLTTWAWLGGGLAVGEVKEIIQPFSCYPDTSNCSQHRDERSNGLYAKVTLAPGPNFSLQLGLMALDTSSSLGDVEGAFANLRIAIPFGKRR